MATANCTTTLERNIMNDCTEPHAKGVEKTFYFISRNAIDWGRSTRDGFIISSIVATATGRGYKVRNPMNAIPAITITDDNPDVDASWTKSLPVYLLADSPENAAAILGLKQDEYVCIYENKEKGESGKQAFGVIGWEQGAKGVDLNLDKSSDTGGGWAGTIVETGAPTPNIFFWETDYATTKAALESLCSA